MLLHKDREQFEAVLNAVSNELGVPVSIVEKDYYVTATSEDKPQMLINTGYEVIIPYDLYLVYTF